MFKRIKEYFSLQRRIQIEVLETLCTICYFLDFMGHYSNNKYSKYMLDHYTALKKLSKELRDKEMEG